MFSTTAAKRTVAIALPTAAVFMVAGSTVDPGVDESTLTTYFRGISEQAAGDRYQISALILYVAFLAFVPAIVGLWRLSRPGKVRTAAFVLGCLGAASLPGLLITDYYDIALARSVPAGQAADVVDTARGFAGAVIISTVARVGTFGGLLVLMGSAARFRTIPVWTPAVFIGSLAIGFVAQSTVGAAIGAVVMVVGFGLLAAKLLRSPGPAAVPA